VARFGFIGAAYQGRTKIAAAEQCINLFPEKIETPEAKAPTVLLGTPGKTLFSTMGAGTYPARGFWKEPATGRVFAVSSNVIYELTANGTSTARGNLAEPPGLTAPVTMRSNGSQLVISSNNNGYLFTLATNTLQQINTANFPFVSSNQPGASGFPGAAEFELLDMFFISLNPGTRQFFTSFVADGQDWAALNFASKDSWPDNLITMLMNKRELWLMGTERGEVWWDAGDPSFPFERVQGASIEVGVTAANTFKRCDGGVFWLGGSEHGANICYRSNGYDAQRISTHALEFIWSKYGTTSDAEAWIYQEEGHTFYALYFPTGDATWVYDCATHLWHQRAWWDPLNGGYHADLARAHVYAFGKHLVSDRASGKIYQQSLDTYTDAGNPIRRLRSCSVFQERKWMYYSRLTVYQNTGEADGVNGAGTEPLAYLRLSDDGGKTWGNPIEMPMGFIGQYNYGSIWRNLGRSQDRAFEWSTSEPIPIALVDAFVESTAGSGA
jgi:hypothetical protein